MSESRAHWMLGGRVPHWLGLIAVLAFVGPAGHTGMVPSVIDDGRTAIGTKNNSALPAYCTTLHSINKMKLAVTNQGFLGMNSEIDCLTGERIELACEYPKGSHLENLFTISLWVGATVGHDTLVSTGFAGWGSLGWEMAPDIPPFGDFELRSLDSTVAATRDSAVSEQDLICTYYDTLIVDPVLSYDDLAHGPHRPLGLKILQRSFGWSYSYAEDFILFDLEVANVGSAELDQLYLGLYADCDAGAGAGNPWDDVCGFLHSVPSQSGCSFDDTLDLA